MTFQDLILGLERYWAAQGCVIAQPYDVEVGAGTMHPATFLRVLGPEPWKAAYVQPSRRPADGRYGQNPNRLSSIISTRSCSSRLPTTRRTCISGASRALGLELRDHDLRFLEDDWADQTLGASGVGWQVFLDGQEISQFTYFPAGRRDRAPGRAGGADLRVGAHRAVRAAEGQHLRPRVGAGHHVRRDPARRRVRALQVRV